MALTCKACGASKPSPSCPKCSDDEERVTLAELNGKAVCTACAYSQLLPKHCGWEMTITT
ncbi:MAG: hypothetical protein AABW54_03605 [Candidatus Micrarchaeota archaeon]